MRPHCPQRAGPQRKDLHPKRVVADVHSPRFNSSQAYPETSRAVLQRLHTNDALRSRGPQAGGKGSAARSSDDEEEHEEDDDEQDEPATLPQPRRRRSAGTNVVPRTTAGGVRGPSKAARRADASKRAPAATAFDQAPAQGAIPRKARGQSKEPREPGPKLNICLTGIGSKDDPDALDLRLTLEDSITLLNRREKRRKKKANGTEVALCSSVRAGGKRVAAGFFAGWEG